MAPAARPCRRRPRTVRPPRPSHRPAPRGRRPFRRRADRQPTRRRTRAGRRTTRVVEPPRSSRSARPTGHRDITEAPAASAVIAAATARDQRPPRRSLIRRITGREPKIPIEAEVGFVEQEDAGAPDRRASGVRAAGPAARLDRHAGPDAPGSARGRRVDRRDLRRVKDDLACRRGPTVASASRPTAAASGATRPLPCGRRRGPALRHLRRAARPGRGASPRPPRRPRPRPPRGHHEPERRARSSRPDRRLPRPRTRTRARRRSSRTRSSTPPTPEAHAQAHRQAHATPERSAGRNAQADPQADPQAHEEAEAHPAAHAGPGPSAIGF